jgi:hypothetical protein
MKNRPIELSYLTVDLFKKTRLIETKVRWLIRGQLSIKPGTVQCFDLFIKDGDAIMPAQTATLTPHQQRVLIPRAREAKGTFSVILDSQNIDIQTITIVNDPSQRILGITGRNTEGQKTVREIYIQFADHTPANTTFDLAQSEFTDTRIWLSLKTATETYAVRGVIGTLSIQQISPQLIKVQGFAVATTEKAPNQKVHALIIDFDIHT